MAAVAIAAAARRARTLSTSGAIAAAGAGIAAVGAGWEWGALLVLFFVTGSALSHAGAARKAARTASVVEKGSERDAMQVLANGGVFGIAAIAHLLAPSSATLAVGAGALAAAAADTFATEIGVLARGPARSITSGRVVPAGTSGGVTWLGTLASVIGAATISLAALAMGWPSRVALAAFAGGIAGSLVDSLLGATLQARRRCPRCDAPTERRVHDCGTATRPDGGLARLDNDGVNLACTAAGGLCAALLAG